MVAYIKLDDDDDLFIVNRLTFPSFRVLVINGNNRYGYYSGKLERM